LLALAATAPAQLPGQQLPGAQPPPGNPFPWQPGGGFQGKRPGHPEGPAGARLHRPGPVPLPKWNDEEHRRRQLAIDTTRHAGHAFLATRHGHTVKPPKVTVPAGGSSWWKSVRSSGSGKGWLAGIGAAIAAGFGALFRRRSA
jgi:hypothetical protein